MYQSRPPVALIPAATTKSTATVSSPFVRESVQSFLDGDDARGHEHGDRADHDVVGLDDVPQEASEGHDDHADGEPSLPNLSLFGHGDGHTDAPGGTYFTLLYGTLEVVKLAAAVPRVPSEYPSPRCVSTSAIDAHRLCV